MGKPDYDIVVHGASGFTGRLILDHLNGRLRDEPNVRWAISGRSPDKLEKIKEQLGLKGVSVIEAQATSASSMGDLVKTTRLVISAVGPYETFGTQLFEACAAQGTDYVDLCGEPLWMRRMIATSEQAAKRSGARMLLSCGFDSVPSELGVALCQQIAMERFGKPMPRIRGRVRKFVGGPSGGSAASGMSTMRLVSQDPEQKAWLENPFALTPGFSGPQHPPQDQIRMEEDVGKVGPFTLGPTDMKNVHRANFLLGHPYGEDFVYDELLVNPPDPPVAPPSPEDFPKPGEGPDPAILENGSFDLVFIGNDDDGNTGEREVRVSVSGDNDPGYKTTARIISEIALELLKAGEEVAPGIWTPVAALGPKLKDRLEQHADIRFSIE